MGLSTTTTAATATHFGPFRPFSPSYFKLFRPCPCFAASLGASSSSRPFSTAFQRLMDTNKRGEKKVFVSRNTCIPPVLEAPQSQFDSSRISWKTRRDELREDKRVFSLKKNEHAQVGVSLKDGHRTKGNLSTQLLVQDNINRLGESDIGNSALITNKDNAIVLPSISHAKNEHNSNVATGCINGLADQRRSNGLSSSTISKVTVQTSIGEAPCRQTADSGAHPVGSDQINGKRNIVSYGNKQSMQKKASFQLDNGKKPYVESTAGNYDKEQSKAEDPPPVEEILEKLTSIYGNILVIDNVCMAKEVVTKLTNQYRHLVHACDTEVARIDVKQETPVDHGEIICFSIYSGPEADFGDGKSCIWVDVLDGGGSDLLAEFDPFFRDASIRKVWHNYSFDKHVIENYGISVLGFHADTMHMARLWDSSRRTEGGYSLEALTGDKNVMKGAKSNYEQLIGKVSMKQIFGKKKVKKDGSEGKIITLAPVEELQKEKRLQWICYSALDAISTLQLYESLKSYLCEMQWKYNGELVCMNNGNCKSMYDFYEEYWQPFGELLVGMETEGMLVDRAYLAEMEKVAKAEREIAVNKFCDWASNYCMDAKYMNVGSDTQLRLLLYGGIENRKDGRQLEEAKVFQVPNVDKVIEEGKKSATKYRNIRLHHIGVDLPAEIYTASGWPSVSGDALKILAARISEQCDLTNYSADSLDDAVDCSSESMVVDDTFAYENDTSKIFRTQEEASEAYQAITALCEVCSIDSLISNFILPLQGSNISGKSGHIHCSLNINTETGRLSARRPNLQNQPALEKDRYKIRQAFIAAPGNSLIVADYGQLELRILAHLSNCKSMLDAFKAGGDFHSRTAMNMYAHIRDAVEKKQVLLEWHPQPGEDKPPVPLLKDAFGSERRKAKMLNFSIAYGKTPMGLARDWKVSVEEAEETVNLWYKERQEVLKWQQARKEEAKKFGLVHTLLGRSRRFPLMKNASRAIRNHIERAAINTPVQGSAADVAMCAMLEISKNTRLKGLGWRLLLQVHDEVILEGPTESAEIAKAIVVDCMSKPFDGTNILKVDLSVDAKCALNWYAAK
uniref:DNA-directed DNA polymerase n=3 Tax=Rhizophora mucronata TaxID=61149 RepID=A0A2P2LDZ8_RHIMU